MNTVDLLKQQLELEVTKLIEQEDVVEALRGTIRLLEARSSPEVRRPAVERLEEEPREVPPVYASQSRQAVKIDSRPFCTACGGRMEPATRELNSGKTVQFMMCTDSGCNNEQF